MEVTQWKIEGHKNDQVVTANAPDEQAAFGVMAALAELGYFPSAYPAASCPNCGRVSHVDDVTNCCGLEVA